MVLGLAVVAVVSALVVVGFRSAPADSANPMALIPRVLTPTMSASPAVPTASSKDRSTSKPARPKPTAPETTSRPLTIAASGPGTYVRARVDAKPTSTRGGRLLRYDVRVEKGLPFDADDTARTIQKILDDPRSWTGSGEVRWQLVEPGQKADLHAYVVTPTTTDELCAPLRTRGAVSCQNGTRVVLNAKRWAFGAKAYGKDVAGYRRYLVNHEFGHALGRQHVRCPGKGDRAPVMMQQTKGLKGCKANPWPSPKRT